jgi:hypothetical protein
VDATQTSGVVEVNRKRTIELSMKYLDLFFQWGCSTSLLAIGLFPDAKEITESVGCIWGIKSHFAKSLKLNDHDVTCIVVGDGAKPRTAALACFMTKWRRVISVDPAITPETMKEFAEKHQIDRLELRSARMQDTVIEIDPEKDKCVLIILPHAHVCPNAALAQLHFPESIQQGGLVSEEGEMDRPKSEEEQADKPTMPRIAVCQLPCCAYEFHDRCAGLSADLEYHDYGIASIARLVRCWWDVSPSARALGALSIGSKKPRIYLNFPHSSSMDRKGAKQKAKQARRARKSERRAHARGNASLKVSAS